jgi:sarcosine oxidase subunit alpha
MREVKTDVLVIGGGPAGLSAATEAAAAGALVVIAESDLHLGGQLVKQSHKFFGSRNEYAGTRGLKIAEILNKEIARYADRIETMLNTTISGYYREEGIVTAMIGEGEYSHIVPKRIVIATGAQERLIPFPNNDIPGVYGAGAVQTLMNAYGVIPGKRAVIVGAGNIGLIVSYQLVQAGVEVAAVLEAASRVGGYWVHAAKIRRLGIPILLRHSIKRVVGDRVVEGAEICEVDENFNPIGEVEKLKCDIVCLAVGLSPTTELLWQAGCRMKYVPSLCGHVPLRDMEMRTSNENIWVAGDASGIEEASTAMLEGSVAGLGAARSLGLDVDKVRLGEFRTRLGNLRSGDVSGKIRAGIASVTVE